MILVINSPYRSITSTHIVLLHSCALTTVTIKQITVISSYTVTIRLFPTTNILITSKCLFLELAGINYLRFYELLDPKNYLNLPQITNNYSVKNEKAFNFIFERYGSSDTIMVLDPMRLGWPPA